MSTPGHKVLFVDNFDSFSFNLVDELQKRGAEVEVYRNDVPAERLIARAHEMGHPLIVISPGPGAPGDAGCLIDLVHRAAGTFPLLGICLGHQGIAQAFGGEVGPTGEVVHGKIARVTHDGRGLFEGLPSPLSVGRYHSLAVKRMPEGFEVSARIGELVMGLRHATLPIAGLQFHPESILTPMGGRLIENALRWARPERR